MRRTVALGDGGRLLVTADVEAASRAALILGLHPHELSEDVDATLPDSIELASVPIDPVAVRAAAEAGPLRIGRAACCAGCMCTWGAVGCEIEVDMFFAALPPCCAVHQVGVE